VDLESRYQNVSILDFIEAKDDESGGGNCSYKDVQSSSQFFTINKPTSSLYGPEAIPVAQPTVSKHFICSKKIHTYS